MSIQRKSITRQTKVSHNCNLDFIIKMIDKSDSNLLSLFVALWVYFFVFGFPAIFLFLWLSSCGSYRLYSGFCILNRKTKKLLRLICKKYLFKPYPGVICHLNRSRTAIKSLNQDPLPQKTRPQKWADSFKSLIYGSYPSENKYIPCCPS